MFFHWFLEYARSSLGIDTIPIWAVGPRLRMAATHKSLLPGSTNQGFISSGKEQRAIQTYLRPYDIERMCSYWQQLHFSFSCLVITLEKFTINHVQINEVVVCHIGIRPQLDQMCCILLQSKRVSCLFIYLQELTMLRKLIYF